MSARPLLVIGLDCLTPQLVFEAWRDELPTFRRLIKGGAWGRLRSTVPPITVPAWSAMLTGRDPGELGFYGFRNRADYSYDHMRTADATAVREPRIWDRVGAAGRPVIVAGVPQTYPPPPVNGALISCFLTPSTQSPYTYPAELKSEIEGLFGEYVLDVEDFRTEDKSDLLRRIRAMSEQRFRVARHLLRTRPWDFAMFVDMGPDRIHHGFWKYMDPRHPKHEPGSPFAGAIRDYYHLLDEQVGALLAEVGRGATVVVMSDHGAQAMEGGLALNEWLQREGYLSLKGPEPAEPTPLHRLEIDWERTVAWGAGGYYGRIFLNVQGREPQGAIPTERYEAVRAELAAKLEAMPGPDGAPLGTRVFRPEDVYAERRGVPPDLIVYFGDLRWRSVGSVGLGTIYTPENDTGPDDANHGPEGIFIVYDPQRVPPRKLEGMTFLDVAPTLLDLLDLPAPADWRGRSVLA